jgi:hypothetical protein
MSSPDVDADGTVHLHLVRPVRSDIDMEAARRRLDPAAWLGFEVVDPGRPVSRSGAPEGSARIRRYETDLGLPIRPGSPRTVFRKAAIVDLGAPRATPTGLRLAIGWRSATLAPLFPVFAGSLDVDAGALTLDGWYAPPGGVAGRTADRALLHIAARGTARWFLDRIAEVLTEPD